MKKILLDHGFRLVPFEGLSEQFGEGTMKFFDDHLLGRGDWVESTE